MCDCVYIEQDKTMEANKIQWSYSVFWLYLPYLMPPKKSKFGFAVPMNLSCFGWLALTLPQGRMEDKWNLYLGFQLAQSKVGFSEVFFLQGILEAFSKARWGVRRNHQLLRRSTEVLYRRSSLPPPPFFLEVRRRDINY